MLFKKVRIMYCLVFQMVFLLGFVPPILPANAQCTEASMSADPQDCSSYYQCLNGEIVKQKCPNESYFDVTCDVCVIDVYGVCYHSLGKCTDGEVKEDPLNPCGYLQCINGSLKQRNCSTGCYFDVNPKKCLLDKNGICSTKRCTEAEVKANPKDLCGYLQCSNGSFVELSCPNGRYYNSTYNACLIDENGICTSQKCTDGEIEPNPKDPCGYLQCINGSLVEINCTSGSYFNSTLKACVVDENGTCPPDKCTEGDIEPNPEDLCGYLQCTNGSLVEVNCTSGSYFNSTLNACVIDENGTCPPEKCTEGDIEPNPEDLCGYLQCINGSLVEVNCTSGSYFNSILNACVIDENGICPSEKCTEGDIEPSPEDLCGYLQCTNGSLVEVNCTSGSYFNSTLNACVIDENGICPSEKCTEGDIEPNPEDLCGYLQCTNGSLVEVNCTSGSYFNSTLNACVIDENGTCPPEKCTEGDIEPNPEDLCGYLQCINGSLVEVNCTSGSYFNSTLNACVIDENGTCPPEKCTEGDIEPNPEDLCGYLQCTNGSLVEVNCTSGSYFNSTLNACVIDENGICPSEKCTEGDIEPNPEDLCGYLQCTNGSLVEKSCADGSYFNSTYNTCLIDENGICPSEKCSDGETEENPNNPCGYFQCVNGSLVEVNCISGSYYNSTYHACITDETGACSASSRGCLHGDIDKDPDNCASFFQCVNGIQMKQLCSFGSYFHSILKSCVVDVEGVCLANSEHCQEGEREVDPGDCASYFECIDEDFIAQSCENGSYFNSNTKSCAVDENFICVRPQNS